MANIPLVVDLDGTLIHTDMLHESALSAFREAPSSALAMPIWLLKGKAYLKQKLSHCAPLNPETLPYNLPLIDWLKEQRAQGRKLVLSTATDATIAQAIAHHVGLFDEVLASDGSTNLAGDNKANVLVARFGEKGFDYAGNATPDLAVWKVAHQAIVVNAPNSLAEKAKAICPIAHIFPAQHTGLGIWRRVLRMHQWMKNLLLFVPMLAGHQFTNFQSWQTLILAFIAFSICASSVYIANDLMDLESDRQHPHKRKRPFASGLVPIWIGVLLTPLLIMASFWLASLVSAGFFYCLVLYFILTSLYTWRLKKLVLIDCITLAMLYTLRIIAGTEALNLEYSFWLLAFAVFIFLSLAFIKRYAELAVQTQHGKTTAAGRGYHTDDATIIQNLGISSGYVSVLVFALYLNSEKILILYKIPHMIWAAVPIILFWISWMWMQAHRGKMHDDPLVFAVKDKASLAAGLLFVVVMAIGALGLPW